MLRPAILVAAALSLFSACDGDEDCGPGEAPADGLTITAEGVTLTYANATSSPNNDCPVDGAATALTIDITQSDPATAVRRPLILCIPRPDQVGTAPIDLADGTDFTKIQLIDVFAEANGCLISFDRTRTFSGTATFSGFCSDGTDPAGYALALDATIPATRDCPAGPDAAITITVSGELSVTALQTP